MKIWLRRSNTFLAALALLAGTAGCDTLQGNKKDEDAASIQLYAESNDYKGMGSGQVEVLRSNPVKLFIRKEPFADERDVARAKVVDSMGGFVIALEFNTHGTLVLNMETVSVSGRRIVVFSRWNVGEGTVGRWLAAPQLRRPIDNGVFVFTPDCSREEAETIVRGLNNAAIKVGNQPKPGKEPKTEAPDPSAPNIK